MRNLTYGKFYIIKNCHCRNLMNIRYYMILPFMQINLYCEIFCKIIFDTCKFLDSIARMNDLRACTNRLTDIITYIDLPVRTIPLFYLKYMKTYKCFDSQNFPSISRR